MILVLVLATIVNDNERTRNNAEKGSSQVWDRSDSRSILSARKQASMVSEFSDGRVYVKPERIFKVGRMV